MDQSQMDYPTAPHNNNNMTLVPELRRGGGGWNGKGWTAKAETWRVVDNVIGIKHSDGDCNRVPTPEQRIRTVDNKGNFSHHVQLGSDDPLYHLWMNKIGPYLGDWVLGKARHDSPKWKLLKFPDGYTLWLHKTGVETDPANPRTDAYLHGAPHLGSTAGRTLSHAPSPTVFRSPLEFVEHAIWLMRARQGQCLCKYCTPGQNQRDINLRLNRGSADDDDDVNGDDGSGSGGGGGSAGGANNGTGGAGSDASSGQPTTAPRGRGAGTRATRGRRPRRDRSPPIMAKDYRVGNQGPGPGPDPA